MKIYLVTHTDFPIFLFSRILNYIIQIFAQSFHARINSFSWLITGMYDEGSGQPPLML